MPIKKLCKTNKEALRWCKVRNVKISFNHIDEISICSIHLGKMKKTSTSLVQTVNLWIKHFNQIIKNEKQ